MRLLLLCAVCLFCLTCLVACENNAPADQLTVVQGTVTSADTGRPLPGVLIGIESFSRGLFGPLSFIPTGDSVRTDAQGHYQLSFRNRKGLYYTISFEPYDYASSKPYATSHYAFITNNAADPGIGVGRRELTLGRTNTVDFKPDELRTVAVHIRNRNTGYQQLYFDYRTLHGNNLDTTAYLRNYYLTATGAKFTYRKLTAAGVVVKDTAIALAVQNSTALPPDTLRATLTFVR